MHKLIVALGLHFAMLLAGAAYANATLNVSGQFSNGAGLAGSFIVDDNGNIVQNSVDLDFQPQDPASPAIEFYNLLETLSDGESVTLQVSNGFSTDLGLSLTFTGSLGNVSMLGPITEGFVAPFVGGTFPIMCAADCLASGLTGSVTVPEPGTIALLGLGLACVATMRRRKRL